MTLLQLIQQVCAELALGQPAVVVGSQDKQVQQMQALLNRLGIDIVRQFEWQRLQAEYLITTVATTVSGTTVNGSNTITVADTTGLSTQFGVSGAGIQPFAQISSVSSPTTVLMNMPATAGATVDITFSQNAYNLPADWDRQIPQTEWDRTNRWPLMGPESSQDWQSFRSGIVYSGPRQRFRIANNAVNIVPSPPNGLLFAYEYVSANWIIAQDGTRKASFTADTDSPIFDDSLLITGLKSQWKAAKGLDGTFDLSEFRTLLETLKGQDKSAPVLSMSPVFPSGLLTLNNVPDGSWAG